jgi:hypothetical protein
VDELVHRRGLPHRISTDLGSNFDNHKFWEYCENSGIDVWYVSVAHLPLEYQQVEEGKLGRRQTSSDHPASTSLGELDYYNAMSTQRHKFNYQPCLADEPRSTPGLGRVCMVAYL